MAMKRISILAIGYMLAYAVVQTDLIHFAAAFFILRILLLSLFCALAAPVDRGAPLAPRRFFDIVIKIAMLGIFLIPTFFAAMYFSGFSPRGPAVYSLVSLYFTLKAYIMRRIPEDKLFMILPQSALLFAKRYGLSAAFFLLHFSFMYFMNAAASLYSHFYILELTPAWLSLGHELLVMIHYVVIDQTSPRRVRAASGAGSSPA